VNKNILIYILEKKVIYRYKTAFRVRIKSVYGKIKILVFNFIWKVWSFYYSVLQLCSIYKYLII